MESTEGSEKKKPKQVLGRKHRITEVLVEIIHWLMFGVSAIFSIRLFTLLGVTPVDQVLFGTLAVTFEGAKITLWEIGTKAQRIVALAFVVISLIASTAVALSISERSKNEGTDTGMVTAFDDRIAELGRQIENMDASIVGLGKKIDELPPAYTTSIERIYAVIIESTKTRDSLKEERQEQEKERFEYLQTKSKNTERTMFTMLAGAVGTEESTLVLYFMLAVSVLLEVGALMTTHREGQPVPTEIRSKDDIRNCTCGSKQIGLERLANGQYLIRCRTCSKNTPMFATENESRDFWNEREVK